MIAEPSSDTGNEIIDWSGLCASATEQAPLPMALIEGGTHIVRYANPAFCFLTYKSRDELIAESFDDLVAKNDRSLTLLDQVFNTSRPASHMEEQHSRSHPLFWSYVMWPVLADDRPVGVMLQVIESAQLHEKTLAINEALILGSVRQHELTAAADASNELLQVEIGERKQVEVALHWAQALLNDRAGHLEGLVTARAAELIASNKQLEAFVYSIAHDLRAPLRAMQGFSTMLIKEVTGLDGTAKDYAGRINKSAQFMDSMLMDLLAFSAVSQKNLELTSVSLESVVDSVLLGLEKEIQDKGARVETSGPWHSVFAHKSTLAQVLLNLIINALKFVAPDVFPIVRLRFEDRAEFIRIWVEDNGIGIAADHQDQIFRLFTRLDGSKYEGTGIGLAIVDKGVERMRGRVGVESSLGQGSRFWLELPKSL
jgi:signal transduction histidine kinase